MEEYILNEAPSPASKKTLYKTKTILFQETLTIPTEFLKYFLQSPSFH